MRKVGRAGKIMPPAVHQVEKLHLPVPDRFELSNGIPVYVLPAVAAEVIKIDVVFKAGRPWETKQLVSKATSRMTREGTTRRNSAEIAEQIDFYGGTFKATSGLDSTVFSLFSLSQHLEKLLPVFTDCILNPIFPEKELDTYKKNSIRTLKVDLDLPENVAYRQLTESIFGSSHPYGYNSSEATFLDLSVADLEAHFRRLYVAENCFILVSGNSNPQILHLIGQYLESMPKAGRSIPTPKFGSVPNSSGRVLLEKVGAPQSAIKLGRRMFTKKHPDYNGFMVLNTLLGGYFGSRLMANIREKKGYTYNIYSSNDSLLFDGYFYIGTEVHAKMDKAVLREIWKEMDLLIAEPVGNSELEMVKNYLIGMLLHGLDGAFNTSDIVKSYLLENLPMDTYAQLVRDIREISAIQIQEMAQRYFQRDAFWEILVQPAKKPK